MLRWIARIYFWLAERLYNELAWAYDPVSALVSLGNWDRWRRLALVEPLAGRILEIGFGTGALQLELARNPAVGIFGLDRSWAMQRVAGRKARRAGVSLRCVQGDCQRLPYPDGCFDTILATFPAGYIGEADTWREVQRCLRKPGGRFVVSGLYVIRCKKTVQSQKPLPEAEAISYIPQTGELLDEMRKLAQGAGLEFRVTVHRFGSVGVPVMVCETF
jgi:ubiquinone/menaquinone biosynthesis C-methylase UbiE